MLVAAITCRAAFLDGTHGKVKMTPDKATADKGEKEFDAKRYARVTRLLAMKRGCVEPAVTMPYNRPSGNLLSVQRTVTSTECSRRSSTSRMAASGCSVPSTITRTGWATSTPARFTVMW